MATLFSYKGFELNVLSEVKYLAREGLISPKLGVTTGYGVLHAMFNMFNRNEIIVGGNQYLYNDVKRTQKIDDEQAHSSWALFRANYDRNKANMIALLNKNTKIELVQEFENSVQFPVFSLLKSDGYSDLIKSEYKEIGALSERLENAMDEEIKLNNKHFFAVFKRIYDNMNGERFGDGVRLIYLPLSEGEFEHYCNKQNFLETDEDKLLFIQTYNAIEDLLMRYFHHKMDFVPIRLMVDNESGESHFYYDVALKQEPSVGVFPASNTRPIFVNEYNDVRNTLGDFLNIMNQDYGHLMPEIANSNYLNEKTFQLLTEEQRCELFAVAMMSWNTHLMWRVLDYDNKSLFTAVQYRSPLFIGGIVNFMAAFMHFYSLIYNELAHTLIYYEDEWSETPLKFVDIVGDFNDKLIYYPELAGVITTMLSVLKNTKEERDILKRPMLDVWENLKDIRAIRSGMRGSTETPLI